MNLIDEIQAAFNSESREAVERAGPGKLHLIDDERDGELAPGFTAMRAYYHDRLLVTVRRGYRQFAGSFLGDGIDDAVTKTMGYLGPNVTMLVIRAFADGVMIGRQNIPLVVTAFTGKKVDELFGEQEYNDQVDLLTADFSTDSEVQEHFNVYIYEALTHMTHATGVAHSENKVDKIWDVWLLTGTATLAASYLAGHRMGVSWKERDVLEGVEKDMFGQS